MEFCSLLHTLDPVCGGENVAAFALVKDYDNEWDARLDVVHRRFKAHSEAEIFAASELYHTPYDIVYLNDDTGANELSKYPVVIYPHPVIMTESRVSVLREYVRNGGTLIVGCRSGLKDLRGHAVMLPQPGLLQELTGTDVCDFTFTSQSEDSDPDTPIWNDILTPLADTKVLDTYHTGYYAGEACLTEHSLEKGRVIHLGSAFSRNRVKRLFDYCGILEPFSEYLSAPDGVELVMRRKDGHTFIFVLNFQRTEQKITLHTPMTLLCSGETADGEIILPPYGTAVYETEIS